VDKIVFWPFYIFQPLFNLLLNFDLNIAQQNYGKTENRQREKIISRHFFSFVI